MAERIQLSRRKGWRKPENTVSVARPTCWGNPFVVGQPSGVFPEGMGLRGQAEVLIPALTLEQSLEFYRNAVTGYITPEMYPHGHALTKRLRNRSVSELRGKNLACWCKLGAPCHADVLLEIANR